MGNDDKKISGNELDDDDRGETVEIENADSRVSTTESTEKKSLWKKRAVILFAFVCLGITAVLSFNAWVVLPKEEPQKTAVIQVKRQAESLLKIDSFVIPYDKSNFSYVSLSVSFQVAENSLRNEIINKERFIRDKIYELLLTYFNQTAEIPTPEPVKDLIAKEVNGALSKGEVNKLYLTQFLFI